MNDDRERAKRYQTGIREILLDWDPIGIGDVLEAQDEYDSYIGPICTMLLGHAPRQTVVEHLFRIATVDMGAFGDMERTEAIADRLLRLRDEIEQSR